MYKHFFVMPSNMNKVKIQLKSVRKLLLEDKPLQFSTMLGCASDMNE